MLWTADEMRTMDGPTLTRCAHQLGLAPAEVWWDAASAGEVSGPCYQDHHGTLCPNSQPWEPHVDLAQADAVLRKLREYGYRTYNEYFPAADVGCVNVNSQSYGTQAWYGDGRATEAHALLLVACLARAAQVGEEGICA
jgi:hypothetical protein